MKPFDHCPICGGQIVVTEVEKRLRGGAHSGSLPANAEVCLGCGEKFYSIADAERFEKARRRLARGETAE
jgi:DNA-directed RNA polymerase subunit RPC12/RpoP